MTRMAVFWILIPLFIGILFIGLYRNLLAKLAVIFGASGRLCSSDGSACAVGCHGPGTS